MSRISETLPPTARAIALLVASTPSVTDTQPAVLHQLLEFSYRYTTHVLSDALVYADHAGRQGKLEQDDVLLAVQARVAWEYGGRIPKEYLLSLANQTNAVPLPAVQEVFGVRLPPASDCLTAVDFDLVPNKPPPGMKLYDEEIEEIEESEEEEEVEMEPAVPQPQASVDREEASLPDDIAFPISAIPEAMDMDIGGTQQAPEEGSDDEDGLFAGGDDDEEDSDGMEQVQPTVNGAKRKLVEDDDYD
jgi:transcription initiation factor TFIID subunit 9B